MHVIAIVTACALLIAVSGPAQAGPSSTVTQKVERAWKDLVGYKFNVSCPFAGSRTCSETGKGRADAHGKCIAKNWGCWVTDAR